MELQLQVTEEELLEFPEDLIKLILVTQTTQLVKLFSVQRKVAVEAVEAVVLIHLPRLKLNDHTIGSR